MRGIGFPLLLQVSVQARINPSEGFDEVIINFLSQYFVRFFLRHSEKVVVETIKNIPEMSVPGSLPLLYILSFHIPTFVRVMAAY